MKGIRSIMARARLNSNYRGVACPSRTLIFGGCGGRCTRLGLVILADSVTVGKTLTRNDMKSNRIGSSILLLPRPSRSLFNTTLTSLNRLMSMNWTRVSIPLQTL